MAGTATTNPLENFKSILEERFNLLAQAEPRLMTDSQINVEQIIPELHTFRSLNGIAQLFYYAFNQTAIRTAIEYETLVELYNKATLLEANDTRYCEYDRALHDLFIDKEPENIDQILSIITKGQYIPRKTTLEQQLASTEVTINKTILVKSFFLGLKSDIQKYRENHALTFEGRFGLLLQYYIDEEFQLSSPQPPSITLKPIQPIQKAPEHLINLPSSGNAKDFEDIKVDDSIDEISEESSIVATVNQPLLKIPLTLPKIEQIHHVYNFKIFNLNIMSGLCEKLKQDYNAFREAANQHQLNHRILNSKIMSAKRSSDQFFVNWYTRLIEGFQALIQSAQVKMEELTKQGNPPKQGPLDAMATAFTKAIDAMSTPISTDQSSSLTTGGLTINLLPGFLANRYTAITVGGAEEKSATASPPPVVPPPVTPPAPVASNTGWFPYLFGSSSDAKKDDDLFTLPKVSKDDPPKEEQKKSGWFW